MYKTSCKMDKNYLRYSMLFYCGILTQHTFALNPGRVKQLLAS